MGKKNLKDVKVQAYKEAVKDEPRNLKDINEIEIYLRMLGIFQRSI